MSKQYFQGETVPQKVHVKDASGAFIVPDTIVITIVDSEDVKKVDEEAMTNEATGKYKYEYLLAVDAALGKWKVEVKAVKGFTAIEQDEFSVIEAVP